jgi:hypothetical protein
MTFSRGDFVEIACGDRTLDGMVTLASPNGQSLIVMFDGMLDGHVGVMPLHWHNEGFIALLTGTPVTLTRKELP